MVSTQPEPGWRALQRIESLAGIVADSVGEAHSEPLERMIYAEGDSWFDRAGANLLDALRTPFCAAVVDFSHIGDQVRDLVSGHAARQTCAMFELFEFDAILLSAGGNDLRSTFSILYEEMARRRAGVAPSFPSAEVEWLAEPASLTHLVADVVQNVGRFVDLRNASRNRRTRAAPIFVHGYDYLQPRPAGDTLYAGSRIGPGPWLYPSLAAAGLDDAQMAAATRDVVDELNRQLHGAIAPLDDVHVIDQRGVLAAAAPGSLGEDHDWLDEIHPSRAGFEKLARRCWNEPLARALGWH